MKQKNFIIHYKITSREALFIFVETTVTLIKILKSRICKICLNMIYSYLSRYWVQKNPYILTFMKDIHIWIDKHTYICICTCVYICVCRYMYDKEIKHLIYFPFTFYFLLPIHNKEKIAFKLNFLNWDFYGFTRCEALLILKLHILVLVYVCACVHVCVYVCICLSTWLLPA